MVPALFIWAVQQAFLDYEPYQLEIDDVVNKLEAAKSRGRHSEQIVLEGEISRLRVLQHMNRQTDTTVYKDRISSKTLVVLIIPCLCDLFCKFA